ncbi:hypothetical protein [Asanoa iriomotensis]|uniref:SdpI/YhfL family protein n=1 Tax=Asanoa iriomotensis TaxID=234613 RepID=A0ABQ4CBZ9_9ACTN|nr:hypothetical protein [Asanoa iriomotensis]GIF60308.1 hypothetical protein Air01nite_64030 [Asanoa iriomotensis]
MKPDWRDTVRVATDVAVLGLLLVATSLPVLTTGAAFATASFAIHHFLTHDRWPRPRAVVTVFRRTLLPGAAATVAAATATWLLIVNLTALSRGTVPGGAAILGLTAIIAAAAAGYAALALVNLGTHLTNAFSTPAPGAANTHAAGTSADTPAAGHAVEAEVAAVADSSTASVAVAVATRERCAETNGQAREPATNPKAGVWRRAARDAAAMRPATVAAAAGVVALAALLAVLVHPILAACLVGYALYAAHVVTRRLAPTPGPSHR